MAERKHDTAMQNNAEILVDSDAFVGWMYAADSHHNKVQRIFQEVRQARLRMITNSWVVAETATVLSHRSGQKAAKNYLNTLRTLEFPIIHIDEDLQEDATQIFEQQDKKGTSMVDCGNVAVMYRYDISRIFSFDRFYKSQPNIEML